MVEELGSMNESELITYNWLTQEQEINPLKIQRSGHQTPDFIVNQNTGYETKTIYGNTIKLQKTQIKDIEELDKTFIVAVKNQEIQAVFQWKNREEQPYNIRIDNKTPIKIKFETRQKLREIQGENQSIDDLINNLIDLY